MPASNRWKTMTFTLLSAVLVSATVALAQDNGDEGGGGDGGGAATFAESFFLSDSIIGQAIIALLLLMSVATVALIIHFLMQNRKATILPAEAVEEVEGLLGEKKFRDAIKAAEEEPSVFGEVMHAALAEASAGYNAMERAIEETADLASTRKMRSLELLNVFGAVGPMIGLFGTVYGMIVAFNDIVEAGGNPNPEELAAGISTALVTTFWGLVVGIPAVAAAALVRNRIEALITEAMLEAEGLIGRFRTGGGRKSGKAEAAGAAGSAKPEPPKSKPEASARPKPQVDG